MNTIHSTFKAKTTSEAIIRFLYENRGKWFKSYELVQKWFYGKFTGISADRRCREMAEKGYHQVDGVKYFIEKRRNGKYEEYRVIGGEKQVEKVEIITKPDGERVARVTNVLFKI